MRIRPWLVCCSIALILSLSDLCAAATLFVSANKPTFVWGESVKVTASIVDDFGGSVPAVGIQWAVLPSSAASVAADGTVTPLSLTTFTIRGIASGITGELKLQVLPKQIKVTPERTPMLVGSTQKMRADALDVSGQPIPNAPISWQVSSELYGGTTSATIDSSGMLKGVNQARVRVVAMIRYTDYLPGFAQMSQGDTLVDIKAPTTYRFERIFVAKPSGAVTSTLAPRAAQLVPTESGGFMFAASLDGLGSALLEWKNGIVTPLLASGRVNLANGYPLADFSSYARVSSGEVLVKEVDTSGSGLVSRGRAGLITPLFASGSSIFGAENAYSFEITRNSVADSGAMLVRVGYIDAVTHKGQEGLFRGFGGGISEPVMNGRDSRIASGDVQGWFDSWGVANDGTAWFSTNNGFWRSHPGQSAERMISVGDSLGSEVLRGTLSSFSVVEPLLFVAGNGDVISAAHTDRGQRFLLWHDGDRTPSAVLPANTAHGVYWYDPSVGALLDATFAGQPRGLYVWNTTGTRPLLALNATSIDGSPVEEILSATNTSDGTIYVMVRTTNNPMVLARLSPNPQVLLKAGDSVPVAVPPVITALIPGARTGMPMVLAGGAAGSVAELDSSGVIKPVIPVGAKLPDGKYFAGSKASMVRTLSDGRIVFGHDYFANNSSLYTWNRGAFELTVRAPLKHADNTDVGYANYVEVNPQGDVAFELTWNGSSLYRLRGGNLTTAIDGKNSSLIVDGITIQYPALRGIDDSGNIFFSGNKPDGSGFYLAMWDGTAAHVIMAPGQRMPDGRQVTDLTSSYASGCSSGLVAGALGTAVGYRNGTWQYLTDPSTPLATGNTANILRLYDTNRSCDVVFLESSATPSVGAFAGGKYHAIQDLQQLTPEGDLLSVTQMLINDDATIYVLGANDRGEEVIYRAAPLNGNTEIPFTARSLGGFSTTTTGGTSAPTIGYARVESASSVFGLAIFGNRQNGVLVSEAAVPATRALRTGRIYAEVAAPINTGIAIANPSNQAATITYSLTRTDGTELRSGAFTIDANKQTAAFLDQAPFNSGSNFIGTFSFSSSVPISVIALRGNSNARGEFLITTLPVIDLSQTPSTSAALLPHFATGGGWTTEILLVNPTANRLTGTIEFYGPGSGTSPGSPVAINAGQQTTSKFTYQMSSGSSYKLRTSGNESVTAIGSVRITPDAGQTVPVSLAVFTFTKNGIVVSEAGVSGLSGNAMQMYAEASGTIQSGIAVANPSNQSVSVSVELRRLDGTSAGIPPVNVSIPGAGQVAKFVNELFPGLAQPFQGVLRLTTQSAAISAAGLRGRTNERGDFLITTTPPFPLGAATSPSDLYFPHLVDGGGYTTQFILIGNGSADSSGILRFLDQSGQPLPLALR